MNRMNAYIRKMENCLHLWRGKLDGIMLGVAESGKKLDLDYQQNIADLESKYQTARLNLNKLGMAGESEWELFVLDVIESRKALEKAFIKLTL